jgi:hypothetical protein
VPIGFGYKGAWLAAKDCTVERLADALGATGVTECSWEEGVAAAYDWRDDGEGSIFFLPPVDGWTIGASVQLFAPFDALPPTVGSFLERVSHAAQTEVQIFGTHRIVEAHGWGVAKNGLLLRYHVQNENGEWKSGEPYPEEDVAREESGIELLADGDDDYDGAPEFHVDEEYIMTLAEHLSVRPTELDDRTDLPETGHVARYSVEPERVSSATGAKKPWWKFW